MATPRYHRGSSTVEITPTPDGEDGTLLRLVHTGPPLPAVDVHRDGWEHALDRLAIRTTTTGGDPGPAPPPSEPQICHGW